MNSAISIHKLSKSFGDKEVFRDFSIDIERGKITSIFGPNGSGKSTLLNILSGVLTADGGYYTIKNFKKFKFSYIFQNYRETLLPWRNNFDNIAFPLEIQHVKKPEILKRVMEIQRIFEANINLQQYPYQLSGGQQQILAIMRALITRPNILFIDEPFSALDYENNLRLREHLQKYYVVYKPTILFITHDIEETVHLAEKIVIFSRKPARVLKIIDYPLRYPRNVRILRSRRFAEVKNKVLSVFQRAVRL